MTIAKEIALASGVIIDVIPFELEDTVGRCRPHCQACRMVMTKRPARAGREYRFNKRGKLVWKAILL